MTKFNLIFNVFFFLWRANNLEDLRQRMCAEIEQISLDIIERRVQSVSECQMVGVGQFQHLYQDVCLFLFDVNYNFYMY
jgi:hypothetical protein